MQTKVAALSSFPALVAMRPRHLAWRWVIASSLSGASACGGANFTTNEESDGSGGNSSSGGREAGGSEGCDDGVLTFHLETIEPDRNCIPTGSCAGSWITIRDANGNILRTSTDCEMMCDDCEVPDCPDVDCGRSLFDRVLSFRFDGSYFANSTCGGGSPCLETKCASPGEYLAEFCLERALPPPEGASDCTPAGTTECFELPFSWPESGEATLVVGEEN